MPVVLVALMLVLAFANGANDVSKGIATLVGSGVSSYGRAVFWGSLCTVAGALAAAFASQSLVETFSGKGILADPVSTPPFLLAIAIGAVGWLMIATLTGLPVSTTHSIAGALAGVAIANSSSVLWGAIGMKIALPLLASPVMSLVLLLGLLPLMRPLFARFDRYCICVEQGDAVAVTPDGSSFRDSLATIEVGDAESCSTAVARFRAVDALHWISSGTTSFFRGLNDAPKILAIGIAAGAILSISSAAAYALVALAMGAGSLAAGVRVTRTLASNVTPIAPANGLAANLATSLLVGFASKVALPVSTTHVSSGAIIGVGLSTGARNVRWRTVTEMLLAWIVTLPVSALLAAVASRLLA